MKPRSNPFLPAALLFSIVFSQAHAIDRIKANNTDPLSASSSWTNGVPGAADIAVWDATVTGANSTVLGADLIWSGIRVASPGGAVTIGGSNLLTLGTDGIALTGNQNLTLNANLLLGATQTWTVPTGRVVTTAGGTFDGGGLTLNKADAGTVAIQNAVTNLPSLVVNGGVVRAADGTGLSSGTALNLANGVFESTLASFTRSLGTGAGQVSVAGASGFSAFGTPVQLNLGNDTHTLVWGTGDFAPTSFVLNAAGANNTISLLNSIDLNGANRTIESRANTAFIPAGITGTGGLTKSGGGTLVLEGANDFTGNVTITNGGLRASDGIGIPLTANLSANGGVFETSGVFNRALGSGAGQFRIPGNTSGFGAQGAALTINFGGSGATLDWGTDANFNPGTLVLNNYSANFPMELQNGINLGDAYRAIDVRANTVTVSGVVSGNAGFTLNGTNAGTTSNSVLIFTNTNTYTGRTVIANTSGGRNRLAVSRDANLGAVPSSPFVDNVVLVTGGVLQANETFVLDPNRNIGIGSSGGNGPVTGGISVQAGKHLTIPGIIANRSLSGFNTPIAVPSTGSLLKIDTGALFLKQNNSTYTGGTTINGGNFAITKLSNGGSPSTIGASPADAPNLNLNGGRLQYYGEGDSTDRLFTVSSGNTTFESSGAGPVNLTNTGTNVVTSAGGRNLNLTGYTTGNVLASGLPDGATVVVTATFTATPNQITVPSTTGLGVGQYVTGTGIPANTTITTIAGTTLTLSAATTGTAGTTTSAEFKTRLTLVKTGSGSWTLSGTNTHTGITRLRGGGALVLDYSGNGNTADPIGTPSLVNEAGLLAFQGKTSGITTDTLTTLQLGEGQFAWARTELRKGTGDGVQLTVNTLQSSGGSTQRHDLINLSGGSGNSIFVNALGSNLTITNGILMNNVNPRASIVLCDTDGSYGFPTVTAPGLIQKITPTSVPPAAGIASTSNTVHNRFTAGDYSTTADAYKYSTLAFDTSGGPINFALGGKINSDGSGKAMLFSGGSDVTFTGGAAATDSAIWFHNYLSDTAALNVGFGLGTSQTVMFGGPGFSHYSGTGFGNALMVSGGLLRVTTDQNPTGSQYRITSGGVFEIGADLDSTADSDLTLTVGDANNNLRFLGDSGVSAYTSTPEGLRTVSFGGGQALVWGTAAFMTNSNDVNYDGDYTFKLSSPRSNATIEVKNNISFNNRNRVIEVAGGVNAATSSDAVLSGVLSGDGVGFTKSGPGVLALTGVNTYTGETRVASGILRVNSTSLNAASRLRIDGGAKVEVTGTVYVSELVIDGTRQPAGPVSAPGFVTGNLIVGAPGGLTPYDQWVADNNLPADKDEPEQDSDDDGIKNLIEYAVGADPSKSGDIILSVTDTSPVTVSFRYWTDKTDIAVHVESSPDLGNTWTTIASGANGGTPAGVVDNVIVTGVVPPENPLNLNVVDQRASTGKMFYRLRVVK